MTKIFAVYLQATGFPNQSSEYAFGCCREQLGRYGFSHDVGLVALFVQVDCHRVVGVDFLQEFDVHIFYPLFLERGQNYFALSQTLSRSRRMRCRVEYYIYSALHLQLDVVCR